MTEAPTVQFPAITEQPAESVIRAERIIETVEIATAVKDAAVAELREQFAVNEAQAAVIERRNLELAEAGLRIVRLEADVSALAASCFARQSALTEPGGREQRLRTYVGQLEATLKSADEHCRLLMAGRTKLLARIAELEQPATLTEPAARPPGGRRRRSR